MAISNPTHASELDAQDLRAQDQAVKPPIAYVLRMEGLMGLLLACVLYQVLGFSWGSFALWFLLPDVAILVYVLGHQRLGMWAYNFTHSSIGAAGRGACRGVVEPKCFAASRIDLVCPHWF